LRVSTSGFFLAAGLGIGSWAANLPSLSSALNLSEGELGLVLLCFALGAILTMTSSGRMIGRWGAPKICLVGASVFGCTLAAVPHASGALSLAVIVGLSGAFFGALDVAMNTDASAIEHTLQKPLMSSFHAVFSIGNFIGAAAVGLLLREGADLRVCMAAAGGLVLATSIGSALLSKRAGQSTVSIDPAESLNGSASGFQQRKLQIYLLGFLAFLAFFAEGSLADWSSIYLVRVIGTSESTGAFGFAVFAIMMAIGRSIGDLLIKRFGTAGILASSAVLAGASVWSALIASNEYIIIACLGLAGLGAANVIPAIFSATGRLGGAERGTALSRVATMGYSGLLAGPPFIGFLAEMSSLTVSLTFVVGTMFVIALGNRLAREN
jgi:MFS family permease